MDARIITRGENESKVNRSFTVRDKKSEDFQSCTGGKVKDSLYGIVLD